MSDTDGGRVDRHGVLTTARLVMPPLTREHLPDLLALYEDPEVVRFLKPLSRDGQLQRLQEAQEMWATRGYGRVAIEQAQGGRFLGRGGLQYWPHFDEVEVTWALRRDAWGRGYATEAGGAWLRWGLEHLDAAYITAFIAPDNAASRGVAERLGMSVLRTDEQHGRPVLVYARAREDAGLGDLPAFRVVPADEVDGATAVVST